MRRNSQMLVFSFVLLLCILGSSSGYGQQMVGDTLEYPDFQTLTSDSNWFPLHVGNTYFFRKSILSYFEIKSTYYSIVYSDTTTINNLLHIGKSPNRFYHYDTLNQVGRENGYVILDARVPNGSVIGYTTYTHGFTTQYGDTLPTRKMSGSSSWDVFSLGVGQYRNGYSYSEHGGYWQDETLLCALIYRNGNWIKVGVQGPRITINPPTLVTTPTFKIEATIEHKYNGIAFCGIHGSHHFTDYRMYHSFYSDGTDTIFNPSYQIPLPCSTHIASIQVEFDTTLVKTHSYYFKIHLKDNGLWPQEKFFPDTGYFKIDYRPMVGVLDETEIPKAFSLSQNFPNPFNPVSTITVMLPESMHADVILYNMLGEKVKTLHSGMMSAGANHVELNASDLSSGLYYYTLRAGGFTDVKKCVVLK